MLYAYLDFIRSWFSVIKECVIATDLKLSPVFLIFGSLLTI